MMTTSVWNVVKETAPGLLAALFYGIVSGSMSFMNKVILTSYKFHYPDVVMLSQVFATSVILESCRMLGLCKLTEWNMKRGREFFLPSCCFALHTTLALAALDDLSIPIYNILRRMLPLATLVFSCVVLKKRPSVGILSSVSLIVMGTVVAGSGDISGHTFGYISAILSVVAQATYLTFVEKTGIEKGVSALDVLHINSINCVPIMFAVVVANGHLVSAYHYPGFARFLPTFSFVINVLLGCVLNYSLFLCATMNSALTTSLVGVVKGVITTIIGFFTFGGVVPTVSTVFGVMVNTVGGIVYTWVKYLQKQEQKRLAIESLRNELEETENNQNHVIDLHDEGNISFHRHISVTSVASENEKL